MGRPPKKASERKSRYVNVSIEKARLQTYKDAAAKGFKGNLAAFIRAACDAALAQQLEHPVKPPADEKPGH